MIAIGAATVAILAVTGVELRGIGVLDAAHRGILSADQAAAFDETLAMASLVEVWLLVVSGIVFLGWLSRVVEVIPPLTGRTPLRGPRQAIGWWFVPFAAWIVPYQIVGDAARRLRPEGSGDLAGMRRAWWATWLLGNFVGSSAALFRDGSFEGMQAMLVTSVVFDLTLAVAGVLLILLVHRIQAWAEERADAHGPFAPVSIR